MLKPTPRRASSGRRTPHGRALLILMLACLSGCATSAAPAVIDTACTSFKPILPSRQDVLTDETKRQILVHDETWSAKCGTQSPQ